MREKDDGEKGQPPWGGRGCAGQSHGEENVVLLYFILLANLLKVNSPKFGEMSVVVTV